MPQPRQSEVSSCPSQNEDDYHDRPIQRIFQDCEIDDTVHNSPVSRVRVLMPNLLSEAEASKTDCRDQKDGNDICKIERNNVLIHRVSDSSVDRAKFLY